MTSFFLSFFLNFACIKFIIDYIPDVGQLAYSFIFLFLVSGVLLKIVVIYISDRIVWIES